MDKIRLKDLRAALNYSDTIVYISDEVDQRALIAKLKDDEVQMPFMENVDRLNSRFMLIENNHYLIMSPHAIGNYVSVGYSVLQLGQDKDGLYIEVPRCF